MNLLLNKLAAISFLFIFYSFSIVSKAKEVNFANGTDFPKEANLDLIRTGLDPAHLYLQIDSLKNGIQRTDTRGQIKNQTQEDCIEKAINAAKEAVNSFDDFKAIALKNEVLLVIRVHDSTDPDLTKKLGSDAKVPKPEVKFRVTGDKYYYNEISAQTWLYVHPKTGKVICDSPSKEELTVELKKHMKTGSDSQVKNVLPPPPK